MFKVSIIQMFVLKKVTSNDTIIYSSAIGNISDIAGKRLRVLDVVIFILTISFQNVSVTFVKIV